MAVTWTLAGIAATSLKTKRYIDAIDKEDYEVLQAWAKTSAAVAVPKDWFKDHFSHPPIWTFLSTLDIPVGFFQGALDTSVPIAGVKKLEEMAKRAAKSKMKFYYLPRARPPTRPALTLGCRCSVKNQSTVSCWWARVLTPSFIPCDRLG